jgi:predicted nuclease of predicted toxin-antitoxin system
MQRFLIDANLPYRFAVWRGEAFEHVFDLGKSWSDLEIWRYAQENDLVIVTKDADFSDWIMLSKPPPKVIHLRIGNMRMRDFHPFIQNIWPEALRLIESYALVIVYADKIECVA